MDLLILHKGQVTHVIDPSSFWMRMGTDADFQLFDEYQSALNKLYNGAGRTDTVSTDALSLGDCVIVADTSHRQISEDGNEDKAGLHWNRARVVRINEDKVDVVYIDLGYTEIVHNSRINNINSDLFYYLPSQVFHLKLAGIRPLTRSWTSRAINLFANRVLDQEVLISLIDYDEASKYGQVVIYTQCEDSRWRCLTYDMLEEDLGLPVEPMPEEFLSQEEVMAALARSEQDASLNSCGLDSSKIENDDFPNETESRENMSVAEPRLSTASLEPDHFRLDSLPVPGLPVHSSLSCESAAAKVPAFDLGSFRPTKSLSLSKMHEDKVEEQRLQTRIRLEQELEDSEEDGEEQEIDWGKSDLLIGEAGVFSDFDSIRQEIYNHHSDQPGENYFTEFLYTLTEGTGVNTETHSAKIPHKEEETQSVESEKVDLKPLTEIEDYEIQKKIEGILSGKDCGELNMVCVLINSIIEPDVTVPCDRLVAVFTAILEMMVRNSDIDPLIAFGALETYLGTTAFDTAIDTVLKTLRTTFVKQLPQTKSGSIYHRAFAELLVILFIRAADWPLSSCSLIQEFAMASLERWVVFNKQRMQTLDSTMGTEQLYLECVEVFIDGAGEMLSQRFPDRCCSLLEEVKYKLLHDGTQRCTREQLLNILLKLHRQILLSTLEKTSLRGELGAHTERILDFPRREDSEVSNQTCVAIEEEMKTAINLDSSGLDRRRGPPSTGSDTSIGWSDEDSEAYGHSLYNEDVISEKHSLYSTGIICDVNPLDSVAASSIVDSGSSTLVASGASGHSLRTVDNNTTPVKAFQRVSAHLQKELFHVDGFKDDMTTEDTDDDSQQQASDELNFDAAELTWSASENVLEEKRKKRRQIDIKCEAHITQEERLDLKDSKTFVVKTEEQNKVHKLNISASEFRPKLSSSSCEQNQVRLSKSSVDAPGYRTDRDLVYGGTSSQLIKSVQCNVENEDDVTDDQEKNFSEAGKEESSVDLQTEESSVDLQTDASWKNEESHITDSLSKSDLEEISPYSLPCLENAVGSVEMTNQDKIIRYTPQELKALNPGASGCLTDLEVTKDSSLADIVKISEGLPDTQAPSDLKKSPSAVPCLRYTGGGDSPLEISLGPKSNSAKWKSLSELLPPSRLKPPQYTAEPSAARLAPLICTISETDTHASEKNKPDSLCNISQSLFSSTDQPVSEKQNKNCDTNNGSYLVSDGSLGAKTIKTFDNAEATTFRGPSDAGHHVVPQWPETFLRSVRSVEDNAQSTSIEVPMSPKKTEKRKSKKKTKFRPVSEVLAKKFDNECHENKAPLSDLSGLGCRNETGVHDAEVGGHVIHQPKLGAVCSSSSKRSSWITELRQERPRADKWVPGRRMCTRCGSTEHTIYDCTQEDPFKKLTNLTDFL